MQNNMEAFMLVQFVLIVVLWKNIQAEFQEAWCEAGAWARRNRYIVQVEHGEEKQTRYKKNRKWLLCRLHLFASEVSFHLTLGPFRTIATTCFALGCWETGG